MCVAVILGMDIACFGGVSGILPPFVPLIPFPATVWGEEPHSHLTHEETESQKSNQLAQIKAGGEA